MSEKHQSDCYRMIGGKKFVNFCDILTEDHEAYLMECKRLKVPHRVFKHPDGFKRLFIQEDRINLMT